MLAELLPGEVLPSSLAGFVPYTQAAVSGYAEAYAAENAWLLSTVLRDEWGFDGTVVSDWGAVRDRVAAVNAGTPRRLHSSSKNRGSGLPQKVGVTLAA